MRALARWVADGFTVPPDMKGRWARAAIDMAAKDSKLPTPHSERRRFISALTWELQAPLMCGKRMREGKSITASITATLGIPERLFALLMTSVVAAVIMSIDGSGIDVEVITLPCNRWSLI